MSWFKDLITDNPMTVEAKRFRNRFFVPGRMSTFNTLVLVLGAMGFFLLMLLSMTMPYFGAESMIFIEAGLLTLLIPAMTHGSIAGERERRTWDVLMTAPVSRGQVVVGKFMGAASGILLIWGLFWVPTILAYINGLTSSNSVFMVQQTLPFWSIVLCQLDVLLYAFSLAAFCVLISSRCRRAFSSFFVSFGIVFFGLVIYPSMFTSLMVGGVQSVFYALSMSWHPMFALMNVIAVARIGELSQYGGEEVYGNWYGEPFLRTAILLAPAFTSTLFTVIFLIWATKTIRFIDFDTRFLPRSKNASSK